MFFHIFMVEKDLVLPFIMLTDTNTERNTVRAKEKKKKHVEKITVFQNLLISVHHKALGTSQTGRKLSGNMEAFRR